MKSIFTYLMLLWIVLMAGAVRATFPIYADGDLAPLGAPDGLINSADYLIASRIALGLVNPTDLEYAHGDLYPAGAPDGVIKRKGVRAHLLLILEINVL